MKTQVNDDAIYREAGSKAGKAARNKDYSLSRFHYDWLKRAMALESVEIRQHVREVFNEAYRQESGAMSKPTYFQ
jgi:hypothetical protein